MAYQEKYSLTSLGELKTRRGSNTVPSMAEITGLDSDTLDGIFTYKWDALSTATNDNINVVQPTVGSGAGRWIRVNTTMTVENGIVTIGSSSENIQITEDGVEYHQGIGRTNLRFNSTGSTIKTINVPSKSGTMALVEDISAVTGTSGSFSGVGTATTVFTVTIGVTQPNNTYKVNATPTNVLSAAVFYVTNKTTTTFDVVYIAGLTGAVAFDWSLRP